MYLPAISWKFPRIFNCLPFAFRWALLSDEVKELASFNDADLLRLFVVISNEDRRFELAGCEGDDKDGFLGLELELYLVITVLATEFPPMAPGDLNVTCLYEE